jgi:hypothetical protein
MNEEKKRNILKEARERLKLAIEEDDYNRSEALDDLEFLTVTNAQWPSAIRTEREANGQPCLTINKLPTFVDQVVGDQRMNRPSIKVLPVDNNADIRTAKVIGGWIKHVERISKSDSVIDHAFEHAAMCGYGAMRVVTKYVSDDSVDEQEAYIQKIDNALAVYWGKHSEYDCSDANYCFIVTDIDRKEYEDTYDKTPMLFNFTDSRYVEGWCTKDTVRVVEYFKKEKYDKTIYKLSDGKTVSKLEEGMQAVKTRKLKATKIMWYLLSGDDVLDSKEWPGKKYIPIIPVWGREVNVGGKRYIRSLIRNGKDPQRMYNYWQALSLKTPIPTPDGWKLNEDLKIGDKIFDNKGTICSITDISPVFENRDCLDVVFDDGSVITADAKHLWTVEERGKRKSSSFEWLTKTITTDQLVVSKHFIYVTEPLELSEQVYSIPPYVLGVWLGDGTSRDPNITQNEIDWEDLSKHLSHFGCKLSESRISNNCVNVTLLGMRDKFIELNLLNNKHIPFSYTRGSKEQRLQLLQGLMDTDGSINPKGQCSFTTTELNIAKGFAELLRTLGIKAIYCARNRNGGNVFDNAKLQYQFSFTTRLPVFRLARKLEGLGKGKEEVRRTKRYSIKAVIPTESVPVRCITVDSYSSLYLAGVGMIPTHNSCDTEVVALQPKSPYFATPKQIEGHESQWNQLHKKSFPYVLCNPDDKAPGWPSRQAPPQASSAMVERINMADQEMRDTVGLQKASLGMQSNERSGSAIRERKKEGDIGTFSFIDNLSRSIAQVGRVLVDIAPVILDTERVIRIGLDNGEYGFDAVNVSTEDGKILNDLSVGTYDIAVVVGPSFTTQRTEAQASMKEFIQYVPQAAPLIGDIYASTMDWPRADEVSDRLEVLLPPEVKQKLEAAKKKRSIESGVVDDSADEEGIAPPQPNPLEILKIKEEELKLKEQELKVAQEGEKLKGLQISNEMAVMTSKANVKKMVDEILNVKEEGSNEG